RGVSAAHCAVPFETRPGFSRAWRTRARQTAVPRRIGAGHALAAMVRHELGCCGGFSDRLRLAAGQRSRVVMLEAGWFRAAVAGPLRDRARGDGRCNEVLGRTRRAILGADRM